MYCSLLTSMHFHLLISMSIVNLFGHVDGREPFLFLGPLTSILVADPK